LKSWLPNLVCLKNRNSEEMNKENKNIESIYPLSPMQQGMLFHTLYAPDSGVYFEHLSCTLHGNLNATAFKQAWQQVVERHPVLRTLFVWEHRKKPLQVVRKSVNLPWVQHDWQRLSLIEQQERLEAFLKADRGQGFELDQAPLMRCALIQMAKDTYQFVWSFHHLLMDGWCLSIILKEVFAFYEAFKQTDNLYLDAPRPYRDYITWLQQQDLSQAETFWRQALQGFTAPTPLVVDRVVGSLPNQRETYDEQHLQLSTAVTDALQSLARHHHLTLNTLVQGAWALLLSRYSGQEDVVFGATVSGRPADLAGVESMVGLFINTLPIRVQVSPQAFLFDWLQQLQAQLLELRQYEYSSLVEVQGWSDVPRGLPLFESIVVFENYPVDASLQKQGGSLEFRKVRALERTNYPLTLVAGPGAQLSLQLSYDCHRFDAATIRRMLRHLQTLLEGIVVNPGQRLKNLPLLTQPERQQLLVEWNDTQVAYSKDVCIHQLFEAQVERTPDAVAVVFEDEQLTYGELNRRANQVAHHLRSLGVGSDVLVGICVERSLEMLVGLLGILKAGGAYVPLDSTYPTDRLHYMLEDAGVQVLLTQARLVSSLPKHNAHIVCLDTEERAIALLTESNPISGVVSSNLAYVIYTSGSTGLPKGVLVNHSNIVRLFEATNDWFHFNSQDVWTLFHSYAFDFSVWELWGALIYGGRLVVVPYLISRESNAFYKLLCQEKVTILNQTPSAFRQLIKAEESKAIAPELDLRLVIFGGEALEPKSLKPWFERHGDRTPQLVNMYGITETTVHVTYRLLTIADINAGASVIGRKIPDLQVYLLDSHLQPLPIGVPGELYIGGAGLARGYLNRPELTAEKFIRNPFSDEPGSRLYKTGDLARYLDDGNIEFLGRIDHQVKIRGFRIELGEIEAALNQHPAVLETVLLAREDTLDNKRLVAYIVPGSGQTPTISELRSFLKARLPDYMVPSAFVFLDALPLTPNGKIDRRALPAPDTSRPLGEKGYVAPQTAVEEMLAGIWTDVLEVKQVSIHDNFFDLGGHSLLATQLISRLRDTFGVEFPLRGLFESPTVASLSERLEALRRTEQGLVAPPLLPVSREGEMLLSFAQARLWFLEQLEPGSWAYNIPSAVHLTGSLDVAALKQSLNEIVLRHEALRTTFAMVSGEPIQVIAPALALSVPLVDMRDLPEAQQEASVKRLATESAQQPFDLAMGPLLRAKLLHLGEAEYVLLLTMHHIVSDGWSMGVLIRELAALYEAFSTGKPSPLPQLPIQYADFAHWQRQWLQGEVLAAQLSYWQQQLAGAQTVLELPTDRPRPAVQTFRGATEFLALAEPLSQKLKTLSQRSGVTLFMTLLAAFQTLLYRYTGQEDICIGSPIANRNRSETEELIGFFVNTLVLRTDMSENPSFQELLGRVREVTLGAYAHQDLPFEQLVEALQPERNLSHHPLFQVMFVLQNAPMSALELPSLTISSREMESSTAKFDLDLSMEDTEQGLRGSLEYNTDLFDAGTISRMLEHFQTLLEGIVAEPDQRLSDLPLLTQPERQQLLLEWNNTQVAYPKDVCIHQLFEAQVERTPDGVAVLFEDEQLTYRELNRRANQVAHHLRSLDVAPDSLVGICVERSLKMIVGLLGILKAGGAYVPLDPDYPSERLAYMLNDSQMPVLVTTEKLSAALPEHQARVVCLDKDWGINSADSDVAPVSSVKDENLAYVIYTSGSTGKPKGVAIAHRSLVNAYLAWEDAYQLRSLCSSHLQMASFSFDVFSGDMVRALCSGAKLVICPREWLLEPEKLYELMLREKIDCAEFVPAVLRNLIQYLERTKQDLSFMRLLIAGSDSWHIKEYEQFQRFCGTETRLINSYGATEATIDSSYFESTALNFSSDGLVPIGRPFANTQIYILDSHLQLVPVGFAGELYIGGAGVARSYLNQPKLTEQKFIPNPFSNEPGDRLYKTGDLGRYLPDGTIEFLGRLDHQVKIRGFRIELGEIEAVLGQHPAVDETVVVVREDVPGNKRLVAYVVVNQTSAPTVSQLHQFLKQKLLDYMIPSAIVKLEALPLTPNGKVDRRALLALDTARPELQEAFIAPRDTLELQLAQIWQDVLNVRPIGVTDNFFTLGGHSLLAVRLIAQIQPQFEQNLPLATLFLAPTIEHLASTLRQPTDERQWSPLVKIQSGGSKRPFFCVPGAGGNVIYFYHLARHLGSDQPFYGLQARGLDGEQIPHTQVEDMAAYYIEALQTVQPQGPYLLGGHSFGSYVAFEMALQLLHQGQEVALLAILDTEAPLSTNKPVEVEHDDDDARYLTELAMTIEQLVGKKLSVSYEDLQPLAPNKQLNYFLERLKTANVFPPEAKLSQLRGLVQVFKANQQTHYVQQEVYPNQITVFPASEQFWDDPAMGWDQVSSEPVETYSVPGDHNTMVTEPHVRVLAEKLRACLDKAQVDDERK
jgi:amino acid adenylation domain-containing protein